MSEIRLSAAQHDVVSHEEGPLLVVAGPGSGKTRVLTERVRTILLNRPGHFRVLALTFTNKAANEMIGRLNDLGDLLGRTFIGTIHGFCLEMLSERGKPLGLSGAPQIFEHFSDRRQILLDAVNSDPVLQAELDGAGNTKEQDRILYRWMDAISYIKTHPVTANVQDDIVLNEIFHAYNSELRASAALDFDDLLILGYRLLNEYPKIASFYRRLYRYVCIDEAQDLNEVQYCIIKALCADEFNNVMMVGDPKQSIYGFTRSGPQYMEKFKKEFGAKVVELTENFRSSLAVVGTAQRLQPAYQIEGQLPVQGLVEVVVGDNERDEARLVVNKIEELLRSGHEDVEGTLTLDRMAVLGRTRYTLLEVERELDERGIGSYKRLSSAHEFESYEVREFLLSLRLIANPLDYFHYRSLRECWNVSGVPWRAEKDSAGAAGLIAELASRAESMRCKAVAGAAEAVATGHRLDLQLALEKLRKYADTLPGEARGSVYEDTEVLSKEWDVYLRTTSQSNRSIPTFMSSMSLGATQTAGGIGIALLTVHSSKGMEFDTVFVVGMADGVFPDFRSRGNVAATAEERRNAFVAVTRSRRLLYLSFPRTRIMPWGDVWNARPSPFLRDIGFAPM